MCWSLFKCVKMVNQRRRANARRIGKAIWSAARPAVKAYGRSLAAAADAEIGRRTAGTSYGAFVPNISSFIPGSGLSLAGRGYTRRSKIRANPNKGLYLPEGYSSHNHKGVRLFTKIVPLTAVETANANYVKPPRKKYARKTKPRTRIKTELGARRYMAKTARTPLTQAEARRLLKSGNAYLR
jgi:hypothetical protein